MANAQIIAADAIWEEDYSADGTWEVLSSMVFNPAGVFVSGRYFVRGLFRLDDTEPGDLDPFAWFGYSLNTLYSSVTGNRTVSADDTSGNDNLPNTSTETMDNLTTTRLYFRGWCRRGLGSEDEYSDFELTPVYLLQSNEFMVEFNLSGGDNVRTEPVTTRVREPVRIVCATTTRKMRKGTLRHLQILGSTGGSANVTYDGGRFIQLNDIPGGFVTGPWDPNAIPVTQ